jgi:hypothetical protein
MEWIKLRSLRSTWWVLAVTVAGAIAIAVAVGVNTKDAAADLTNNALAGISLGLLLMGVLGVLVMTGEYSSGTIRATLAAIPNRPLLLAAKAAVFGVVTLAIGEVAAFIAFFAGDAALPGTITGPALGQPGVLRAVPGRGGLLPDRAHRPRPWRHHPARPGRHRRARWRRVRARAARRRGCQLDNWIPPGIDRRELPERGEADGPG